MSSKEYSGYDRYAYGACPNGCPLTGYVDGSCSGDCHPITDDRYQWMVDEGYPNREA